MWLRFFEALQESSLSRAISESTWGYPIIGAFHVLALALFGGCVLLANLRVLHLAIRSEPAWRLSAQIRGLKRLGFALVMLTGLLIFVSGPVRYAKSVSFRIKLLLLFLLGVNALWCHFSYEKDAEAQLQNLPAPSGLRRAAYISLALWMAVIFASRGIAFF